MAYEISQWSKDPSTKVGAIVIGNKGQVVSQGYNGFPRGIDDSEERYLDKTIKYDNVVHAEMNCIYNACYNGSSLDGTHMYIWGLPPCSQCTNGLIQVGIKRIIFACRDNMPDNWMESWNTAKCKLHQAKIPYQGRSFSNDSKSTFDSLRIRESARYSGECVLYNNFDRPESRNVFEPSVEDFCTYKRMD